MKANVHQGIEALIWTEIGGTFCDNGQEKVRLCSVVRILSCAHGELGSHASAELSGLRSRWLRWKRKWKASMTRNCDR
eukprot:SAG31_NODE_31854_length_363_cov_0.784091_1_plen_77_part_10